MTTPSEKSGSVPVSHSTRGGVDFVSMVPVHVDSEDAMGPVKCQAVWNELYKSIGVGNESEGVKAKVRGAVYVYAALNGTSREGGYTGKIKTADGREFEAVKIVQATTLMNIRKFFRGCADEAYEFYKATSVMEGYPRFVAKAGALGVSPEHAFAMADFFGNCNRLGPMERRAHDLSFNSGVERARRNRGGVNLEKVEADRVSANLKNQGPLNETGPVEL